MRRISVFSISILLICGISRVDAQDTIPFVRKIKIAADILGPAYHIYDRNLLTAEGFISVDTDTNRAVVAEAGYSNFRYSQYNYDYLCNGFFVKLGMDFNLLDYEISRGIYYAGLGLRYGLALSTSETPFIKHENYWGTAESFLPGKTYMSHYAEVLPGIRSELFRNFSIGWTIRLRVLIFKGTGKNPAPVFIPGYGNGTRRFNPGINYYIAWSIPYKKGK